MKANTDERKDYANILRIYSTEEAAKLLKIRPQTLRAALCRDGNYAGVKARKLPSRFLGWPADEIERLVRGEVP